MARVLAWALGAVLISACGGRALTSTDSSSGGTSGGIARGGASGLGGTSGAAAAPSFAGTPPSGGASSPNAGASSGGSADVGPGVIADHPRATVKFFDCEFAPLAGAAVGPFASPDNVRGRIEQFVNVLPLMRPGLPPETTPSWAATQMAELLDANASQQRAGDGLTDFLQIWTTVSDGLPGSLDGWHPFTQDWAYFAELGDFTLADLLAGTSVEPHRVGIFTDPAFVSQKPRSASRGLALASALFCQQIPPPPPGISLVPAVPGNGMTFRQAYSAQVASPVCASCHVQIDPLGFSLEHFGSDGSYRDLDNGQPVDSSGAINTDFIEVFDGIDQLATSVSADCAVAHCFAEAELEYALRVNGMLAVGEALPVGSPDVNQVAQRFTDSGRNLRALSLAIAQSAIFLK